MFSSRVSCTRRCIMGLFDFLRKKKKDDEPALGISTAVNGYEPQKKRSSAQKKAKVMPEEPMAEEIAAPVDEEIADEEIFEVVDEENVTAEDGKSSGRKARIGTFDIKKAKDGRYVFNLYNANHIIIATSQIYSSAQSALGGVKSVIANAPKAATEDTTLKNPSAQSFPKWEIYIDKAGEYRFRLYATNGSCICHAKAGYATKSNCKRGIDSIIRLAEAAQIDKSYLAK